MCNGIDRFKNSELYDRRVACLGEGILFVGDGCVYRNRIPVQNGISSRGCGPEQTREQAIKDTKVFIVLPDEVIFRFIEAS